MLAKLMVHSEQDCLFKGMDDNNNDKNNHHHLNLLPRPILSKLGTVTDPYSPEPGSAISDNHRQFSDSL